MSSPDFLFGVTPGDVSYDEETFPNAFTIGFMHRVTRRKWVFEISDRRNDIQLLCRFIDELAAQKCRMIGYNNIGFDYPVLHFIYKNRNACITYKDIYDKAMSIINAPHHARFAHMVWESEWIVEQLDLYKIHHFDNMAKATSLKVLEFNMGMQSIEDLPFDVGTTLTSEQIDVLISYMWHDIKATDMFADRTVKQIAMREGLSSTFDKNMMNMSDVKIGEVILVTEMEKAGIKCFEYVDNKKKKRQTKRDSVDLGQVIFPYVKFERVEFQNIQNYLAARVITEFKGVFKGLIATVDGVDYKFGTGGIHASVESQVVHTNDTHQLVDVDVASFYPNLAIKNKLYPAHLGEEFGQAYEGVYHTRKTYAKGTPENGAFKLALNGAYGGSNNEYSPFFDTQFTMAITINGQLLLCMLVEQMLKVPGLRMIQANTDGITYLCPHEYLDHTRSICRWWEQVTNLELEEALYSRMFIRDVNSYMAEYQSGDLKRIGAYAHITAEEDPGTRELPYHKDWSARIVAMAGEAALVRGEDIREFITNHGDTFDFFLRTKVPRSSILEWGGEKVSNIVRYYISTDGKPLEKVMPPNGPAGEYKRANKLTNAYYDGVMAEIGNGVWDERIHTKNQSTYGERRAGVNTGWKVWVCNNLDDLLVPPDGGSPMSNINYEWYITEAEKLVKPLLD
tara:strand:- start:5121 stop:7157 length:2037 start_codon:yes stop_codon:yes gene_type:complete